MSVSREQIFSALFSLASGAAGFATASRTLQSWDALSPTSQMPALFLMQGKEDAVVVRGLPTLWKLHAELYVYAGTDKHSGTAASTVLNGLLDAITLALAPDLASSEQTLGGLVSHCRIEGAATIDEGVLGDVAMAILPIEIIVAWPHDTIAGPPPALITTGLINDWDARQQGAGLRLVDTVGGSDAIGGVSFVVSPPLLVLATGASAATITGNVTNPAAGTFIGVQRLDDHGQPASSHVFQSSSMDLQFDPAKASGHTAGDHPSILRFGCGRLKTAEAPTSSLGIDSVWTGDGLDASTASRWSYGKLASFAVVWGTGVGAIAYVNGVMWLSTLDPFGVLDFGPASLGDMVLGYQSAFGRGLLYNRPLSATEIVAMHRYLQTIYSALPPVVG